MSYKWWSYRLDFMGFLCGERMNKQGSWVPVPTSLTSSPLILPPVNTALAQFLSHPERSISEVLSAARFSDLLCCWTGPEYDVLVITRTLPYFKICIFCVLNCVPCPHLSKYVEVPTPGTCECYLFGNRVFADIIKLPCDHNGLG